ncbi:MAG: preprotein translocase subunit YajC [Streptosporangiaceae bacterium]
MQYLAASSSGKGSYTFLIVIVVLFGLLYFVMIRPQRNRQRQAQQMQNTVRPGQRVRTTSGMYATVVDADDQDVVLEVAPGVQMRFLRRAVMETLPDDDGMAGTEAAGSSFDETDSPEDTPAEGSTDGPAATEHLNGSGPGSTGPGSTAPGSTGLGSTAADHTAQDERTAD